MQAELSNMAGQSKNLDMVVLPEFMRHWPKNSSPNGLALLVIKLDLTSITPSPFACASFTDAIIVSPSSLSMLECTLLFSPPSYQPPSEPSSSV
ncbi:hypothetical protein GmHk_02G006016 [Glycine max]|nr:hypothetical protein GmHk_02G006016 [Glycine max]